VVEGVRPGSEPVVLVLEPGLNLRGRVLDDLGNAVTSFIVRGRRDQADPGYSMTGSVSGGFRDPEGAFSFAGLLPGAWEFSASVGRRPSGSSVRVVLPNPGEALVLVLPRGTTVSGNVVDPDGHPVAGAQVKSSAGCATPSKEDGAFELSELPAGRVDVWAEDASYAPSEIAGFRIQPGGLRSGVRLVLRRGGTIVCQVLDAEGRPESGRGLALQRSASTGRDRGVDGSKESDAEGRVVFENVAPGSYSLGKCTTRQESMAEHERGPNLWTRFEASRTQASVDVVEGGVTKVVIGGPRGSPIRLRGRVTDAGIPVAGMQVGESTTGADGRFELLLPEPADLELFLYLEKRELSLTTWRRMAGSSSEPLDLVLPRGRISGVVRSSEDRPLDGVRVTIESDGLDPSAGAWTSCSTWTTTAGGGRFSFQNLPGGRYELRSPGEIQPLPEGDRGWPNLIMLAESVSLDDLVIRLP
jgi:hypothetical protein